MDGVRRRPWLLTALLGMLLVGSGCSSMHTAGPSLSEPTSGLVLRDGIPTYQRTTLTPAEIELRRACSEWASAHVQTGDIVFRHGSAAQLLGLVDFSEVAMELTQSHFSHASIAVVEDGEVYVYHIDRPYGPHRETFADFICEFQRDVGVKRLRPEYQSHVPAAVAFCKQVVARQTPFDADFLIDDNALYCTEMVEKAYRSSGLRLSEPIALGDLPGVPDSTFWGCLVKRGCVFPPEQELIVPGNDQIGLWSSPALETIVDVPCPRALPGLDMAAWSGCTSCTE